MPELPEVETIVRGLRQAVLKKKIKKTDVYFPGIVVARGRSLPALLRNDSFCSIGRHGKYLMFTTNKGTRLVVHLRMTGQLFLTDKVYRPDKHVHLLLTFGNGQRLIYRDIRKFGRWTVVPPEKEFRHYINAGTDALTININELKTLIKEHPARKLKAFLLDQLLLAGIGNIYADEICFALELDPETPVGKVNGGKLLDTIRAILKLAIKHKGTSVSDYLTSRGAKGNFQNLLKVYKQKFCPECGAKIVRKKVAGRSSHVCPKCQKGYKK
jgi:formamidopyrimidine-DNA glycosylase